MPDKEPLKPITFREAVESASFHIQRALISLRDHTAFSDEDDPSFMVTAALLSSILEDSWVEAERVIGEKERQSRS